MYIIIDSRSAAPLLPLNLPLRPQAPQAPAPVQIRIEEVATT